MDSTKFHDVIEKADGKPVPLRPSMAQGGDPWTCPKDVEGGSGCGRYLKWPRLHMHERRWVAPDLAVVDPGLQRLQCRTNIRVVTGQLKRTSLC